MEPFKLYSMRHESHLSLQAAELAASEERSFVPAGWCIIRLSRGAGYCFEGRQVMEVAAHELLVVPPASSMTFRVSGIGDALLHYFHFQPELLGSLLSLTERQHFIDLAASPQRKVAHLPATHDAARQFTDICAGHDRDGRLFESCKMLVLAGTLFAPDLQALPQTEPPCFPAEAQFPELAENLPKAGLLENTPGSRAAANKDR